MITIYHGNVRQGKTYGVVIELFILWLQGYTIYSNTWLAFPFKKLTMDFLLDMIEKDLEFPEDKVAVFIDEIPVALLDSRASMSKKNRIGGYFLSQSGKMSKDNCDYGIVFYCTAQYLDMCDKRLRKLRDRDVESEKFEVKGEKFFMQTITVWRGKKSYSYHRIIKGIPELYALYDTRRKIKYEKDRYNEKEMIINIDGD